MAPHKVATAASNNPLLKTLVAAASGQLNKNVNLVDALNGGELTVFAPVDGAFADLEDGFRFRDPDQAGRRKDAADGAHLPRGPGPVLRRRSGQRKTLAGPELNVTGESDNLKVNGVPVICGGVHTANATVYLIDSVLDPTKMSHF